MQVTTHPTRAVGRPDAGVEAARWLHAGLWLDVRVPDWDVRRVGHVHLVARGDDPSSWSRFDLSSHPMRPVEDASPLADAALRAVVAALDGWLVGRPLSLHRHADIGLVSELGEGRPDFQRRMMTILRPELQRRVAAADQPAPSRWPWRRRAAATQRADRGERPAQALAELEKAIETREVGSMAAAVRRAEIGVLLAPSGLDLAAARSSRSAV